jgi:hypothetical protein
MNDGEWDPKFESKIESDGESNSDEFEKVKRALKILEAAKVLEPENLKMLHQCS